MSIIDKRRYTGNKGTAMREIPSLVNRNLHHDAHIKSMPPPFPRTPPSQHPRPRWPGPARLSWLGSIGLLTLLSAIWGGSFVLIDMAGRSFSPPALSLFRLVLASLFFIPFFACARPTRSDRTQGQDQGHRSNRLGRSRWAALRPWLLLFGIAVFGNALPFTLVGWAEHHVASVESAIAVAIAPIIVLILSHFMTADEPISPGRALGIIIGFSGILVLFLPQVSVDWNDLSLGRIDSSTPAFSKRGWAIIALFITAGSYAFGSILIRHLAMRPLAIMAISTTMAAAILLCFAGMIDMPTDFADPTPLAALIFLAVIGTTGAGVVFVIVLQRGGAVFASQCHYLIPVFTALWGALFLEEIPALHDALALILILSGLFLTRPAGRIKPAK